ncbi:MAG: glycoside hydrolase family 2 TIM barrel-domain containing protein [Planctomycetota bacterium]
MLIRLLLAASLSASSYWAASPSPAEEVTVEIKRGRAQLVRDGKPYVVKGAGGNEHLELLAASGGNSIRTWSVGERTGSLLKEAHKAGLSVTLGIWLRRTGEGDYGDERFLARQESRVRRAVERHRDDPALLVWALGNEMEGSGDDPRVYEQLERLARIVKELDPSHPTMTVIADLGGGKKVRDLDRLAPSIDIIGINTYGAAGTVGERYRAAGGERPYMVTEFGPRGHWESPKAHGGLPIEESSTAKAKRYRESYERGIAGDDLCIGSYAFLWGDKQETTATWYGMLLPDGSRLGAVDAMTELWTGKAPRNECPEIDDIEGAPDDALKAGESFDVSVRASDPYRDRLKVEWVLRSASPGDGSYGREEAKTAEFPKAISRARKLRARVTMPEKAGPYRLFAYVRDGKGGAAVHNVPLVVKER